MRMNPAQLIDGWLATRLNDTARLWFDDQRQRLRETHARRTLDIALGMIPRKLGKADLALDATEVAAAATARPGWNPQNWSVADAARALVLIESHESANEPFAERFAALCRSADLAELIGLYRALPLYPDPATLEAQAAEGLRSNVRTVFEAVAHTNPFPREQFSEERWNHMVLKALFVGSTLAPIDGLDERANPDLARMLCDYAHERWAAGRAVVPELWRCVGPQAAGGMYDDLARAAAGDEVSARAVLLSLVNDHSASSEAIRADHRALAEAARNGSYDWASLQASPDA